MKKPVRKLPALEKSVAAPIDGIIHTVRGERVILDADIARIYGVETKILNQAVKRNRDKFPPDFLSQLTAEETEASNRSQSVTGSPKIPERCGHKL